MKLRITSLIVCLAVSMDVAVSKVDVSRSARSFHHRALFFSSAVVGTTSVAGDAPVAPAAMKVPAVSVKVIVVPPRCVCAAAVMVILVVLDPAAAVIPAIPLVISPDPAPYAEMDESWPLIMPTILLRVASRLLPSLTCASFAVPSEGALETNLIVTLTPVPPRAVGTLTVNRSLAALGSIWIMSVPTGAWAVIGKVGA